MPRHPEELRGDRLVVVGSRRLGSADPSDRGDDHIGSAGARRRVDCELRGGDEVHMGRGLETEVDQYRPCEVAPPDCYPRAPFRGPTNW